VWYIIGQSLGEKKQKMTLKDPGLGCSCAHKYTTFINTYWLT
jgi:hypothetical protein